ncbi:MAG: serine/threonine-protein kinase, partial [Verrucomicrobiales bacterium]|nr:serine/threonine-protein kinase [Verrucomicrobiales bacterium]
MGERYEIVKKIGQGGVGEVFVAQDTQLGREVALKRIMPGEVKSDGADDLFAEAKTLSALQHPNIVTIYDIGEDEEGPFAVMELLKGETLDRTVDRGALTLEDFRNVVRQTLEGLMAAQTVGVLHRDLKPANLMVIWLPSGKFQLKILDFGLAKFSKQPSEQTSDQGDGIMGSIYFMAPEQFERGALDLRTDMYSLGCVYYYALTQRHPFEGDTPAQVMASHLRHDVTDLRELRPDLPAELCTWVMWFINRKPEDRPDDAKQAFDYFKEQNAGEAPPVPVPVAEPKRPSLVVGGGAAAPRRAVAATPAIAPTTVLTEDPATLAAAGMPGRPGMPTRVQKKSGGGVFPKWALVTLPLLLVAGGFIAVKSINQTSEQEAGFEELKRMMQLPVPEGDAGTVGWLVEFLEDDNVMAGAATVLAKLSGPGVAQEMVRRLPGVKNPKGKINLISAIGMQEYEGAGPILVQEILTATDNDVRKQALGVLMGVASERDLQPLIKLLPKIKGQQEQAALQE